MAGVPSTCQSARIHVLQLRAGKVANRLEHHEPAAARSLDAFQEALIDERAQCVQGIDAQLAIGVADLVGALQRAATGEDRHPGEEFALRRREEPIAPSNRLAEGSLPPGSRSVWLTELTRPMREAIQDLRRAQQLDACRGELNDRIAVRNREYEL